MDTDKLKTLALAAEEGGDIFVMMGKVQAFQWEATPAAVLELIAEVERLRADAERYCWLRDKANGERSRAPMVFNCNPEDALCWTDSLHGTRLDAVLDVFVDAAIEKEKA